jgi:pyridoxine kinase
MKKIAVISDISGLGRCSLSASLPVISALGCECCPIPTAVFTNQTGYDSYSYTDLTDLIPKFAEEWLKLDFSPDAILTGYMTNERQVEIVSNFLSIFSSCPLIVVDPSMADSGEIYKGFTTSMGNSIKVLCSKADIITPNVSEFCVLSGIDYNEFCSFDEDKKLSTISKYSKELLIGRLKMIAITGIKCNDKLKTVICTNEEMYVSESKLFPGDFSGTGDIFSSALTALRVKNTPINECLDKITNFISSSIHDTTKHPHNCMDGIDFQNNIHLLNDDSKH